MRKRAKFKIYSITVRALYFDTALLTKFFTAFRRSFVAIEMTDRRPGLGRNGT